MIVYKLVKYSYISNLYRSLTLSAISVLTLEYNVGEVTKALPNTIGIATFDSIVNAKEYLRTHSPDNVFLFEAKPLSKPRKNKLILT